MRQKEKVGLLIAQSVRVNAEKEEDEKDFHQRKHFTALETDPLKYP